MDSIHHLNRGGGTSRPVKKIFPPNIPPPVSPFGVQASEKFRYRSQRPVMEPVFPSGGYSLLQVSSSFP